MREQWGLPADQECIGMVLCEWSKRDEHEKMAHMLGQCKAVINVTTTSYTGGCYIGMMQLLHTHTQKLGSAI